MNKYQSILSAVISAVCIFVLPVLQKNGIVIDESTATTVIIYIIGSCAFVWTAWKNHNITDAAFEAQLIMRELKEGENGTESEGDNDESELGEEEEA